MKIIILLFLFSNFSPLLAKNFFLQYIEDSIDPNIKVCDNFYRHVCKKSKDGRSVESIFQRPTRQFFENAKYSSNFVDISKFQKFLEKENRKIIKKFSKQTLKDFEKLCKKNQNSNFLTQFAGNVTNIVGVVGKCVEEIKSDGNCVEQGKSLEKCLDLFGRENEVVYEQQELQDKILTPVKIYNWLITEGNSTVKKLNETFHEVKENASNLIKQTPWLQNTNNVHIFENLTLVLKYPAVFEEFFGKTEKNLKKAAEIFASCVKSSSFDKDIAQVFCLYEKNYENLKMKPLEHMYFEGSNGQNRYFDVKFGLTFYYAAHVFEKHPEYFGFIGTSLIGHEFAHSLIISDLEKQSNNVHFSNEAKQCVQQQFRNTCEAFGEETCKVTENHFEEHGADILGFQLAHDIFKGKIGSAKSFQIK
ncbi:unnamed protein product [Caenorhabditis angaria]|uniref:Peptidase M13 C-terminal domain-containing protein n=1 Tax=Caenorhabditis angaria TaxID=860376 RepID=A0A9P1J3Z6_9PELO|nr:unnamed protein product [Caenorhabditis angaria]